MKNMLCVRTFVRWGVTESLITLPPIWISTPNMIAVGQTLRAYGGEIDQPENGPIASRLPRSPTEVIASVMGRSGSYEFLLVILQL